MRRFCSGLIWVAVATGAFLGFPGTGQATDRIEKICLSDEPLLIDDRDGEMRGLFIDLFRQAAERIGRDIAFERLPWKRCQLYAGESQAIGLGPLTRNSRREAKYAWVAPLFPMRVVYLTQAGSGKHADSLAAVREMIVGVKEGSVSVFVAKKHEIPESQLVTTQTQDLLLRMLLRGRIDTWQVWDVIGHRTLQLNLHDDELAGAKLEEGLADVLGDLWFAASPGLPVEEVALWRGAFEALKAEGILDATVERHLGTSFALQDPGPITN